MTNFPRSLVDLIRRCIVIFGAKTSTVGLFCYQSKANGGNFFNENLQVVHISENVADRQLPMLN